MATAILNSMAEGGVIRILNFFRVWLPKGRGEILLKGCTMRMGYGRRIGGSFGPFD